MNNLTKVALLLVTIMSSCKSFIPENLDALGNDIMLNKESFDPYLGRTTQYNDVFNIGRTTTLPLKFKAINVRTADGEDASFLLEKYPVKAWTQMYSGLETTYEEIEAKRKIEYRPILEVRENNGNITFWNSGSSDFIDVYPLRGYLFDIEYSNTGGRKYFNNVRLKPRRERPFEPSNLNDESGTTNQPFIKPTLIQNLEGVNTGKAITNIQVYLLKNPVIAGKKTTLTVSVLDSMGNVLDIKQKFKDTNFEKLVHGFSPRFEGGKVIYDVLYPIPLIVKPTAYTNSQGDRSKLELKFNRMSFSGELIEALLKLDFAIYEEGNWEIQFWIKDETPNFG